jgi:FemAB-related protein (PEP-CTERM system-associated)
MKLVALEAANREAWDRYVQGRPEAWVTHDSGWALEVVRALGHEPSSLLAIDGEGKVRGVLPLAARRSLLFGNSLVSLPGANWCGLVADAPDVAGELASEAVRQAAQAGLAHVELRGGGALPEPFAAGGRFCRFPIELPGGSVPEPDKQTRRRLRRAGEAGLTVEFDACDLNAFYRVYLAAMARLGSPPFGRDFFEALAQALGPRLKVLLVRASDGEVVAADLLAVWKGLASSLFAGATRRGRELQADLVAIQEGLRHAARLGCGCYDLGRSTAGSGGQTFKEHFGARAVPLAYWRHSTGGATAPELDPTRPLWLAARATWRLLPGGLQARLGPRIARHLL